MLIESIRQACNDDMQERYLKSHDQLQQVRKHLFWNRVVQGWSDMVSNFNDAYVQCPCFSCKMIKAHFKLGSCHEVDIQIQAARKGCLLKNIVQNLYEKCPEEICLVGRFSANSSAFLDFDDEIESLELDESPARAILQLCFAMAYPNSEKSVIEDAIDELLVCLQT